MPAVNFINCCFIEYIYLVTGELCGDLFCYNVSSERRNWDEANTSCAEMGMSLALRNILNDSSTVLSNTGDRLWIGFIRDGLSDFIWNDGVLLTNTNLFNGGDYGDCGIIHYDHLHRKNCNSNRNYVCQKTKETGDNIVLFYNILASFACDVCILTYTVKFQHSITYNSRVMLKNSVLIIIKNILILF